MRFAVAVVAFAAYVVLDGKKISERKRNARLARKKRFVIVGAGFAGVEAASELARELPAAGSEDAEIILIDQRDYLLFTPMLTEAVGSSIQPHHIIVPLSSYSDRITSVRGVVKQIDLATRTVTFADEKIAPIHGDYLLVALGATSNFHHIPGAEEAAFTLKSLDDALGIRQNAMEMIKSASEEHDAEKRKAKLTFVVAGGGYTGVEAIAALNELVRDGARKYSSLQDTPIQMVIAEPMQRLMPEVTEDLAFYAQKQLESAGIRVLLKTGIKTVHDGVIGLTNGEQIRAGTFIWTAGVQPNPVASERGGLKVNSCLELEQRESVWAVGDVAEVPKPDGKGSYGGTAQNATREGKLAAQNMLRSIRGEAQKPFRYTPIGELALVGKQKGIARVYGVNFSGLTAYLMWRAVYILKMPSWTQRIRVISDWCADLVLGPADEYLLSSAHTEKNPMQAQR